ncbi:MHYT domain-containing protein [Luteipulveratus halotolerans]|uniref:MHYT domain-containing protein n=1 Tax=Luteipulveratus halotolerans TaxID=1631356 RepID=UPI000681FE93|nr:MHYT domain-containing protein [Luteipulveratus halotolerans]
MSTPLTLVTTGVPAYDLGDGSVEHFQLGPTIPVLAFLIAVAGALVGLACTRQAASAESAGRRRRWQAFAAVSLGGVAVWMMHFVAMLGMAVPGSAMRYDVGLTVASAAIAIVTTFVALLVAGHRLRVWRLLLAALVMGGGIAAMHLVGMHAMHIQGMLEHDPMLSAVAGGVAVVVSVAVLWCGLVLRHVASRFVAALVIGAAASRCTTPRWRA